MANKLSNKERETQAAGDKLSACPLCESTNEDGHERCFHCSDCGYLQCCDNEGFYDRHARMTA